MTVDVMVDVIVVVVVRTCNGASEMTPITPTKMTMIAIMAMTAVPIAGRCDIMSHRWLELPLAINTFVRMVLLVMECLCSR